MWPATLALLGLAVAGQGPPERALVLTGGTLVDVSGFGSSRHDVRDAVVVMRGGEILAAGPRKTTEIPAGAEVVRIDGAYVVPGLVDVFAGLNSQAQANAYLYMGVTSIVALDEPGGRRGALFRDARPGPRQHRLEVLDLPSPTGEPAAPTNEALIEELEAFARGGAEAVLLYYPLAPEHIRALVPRARALGLATIGELGRTTYAEGLELGVDAFVHTSRYSLDLAPQPLHAAVAGEPFGPPRTAFYEYLAKLSIDAPEVGAYARRLAAGGTALVPTLSIYAYDLPEHENPWTEEIASILDPKDIHLPLDRLTGKRGPDQGIPGGLAPNVFRLESRYARAGARYLAGSGTSAFGTLPGIALHGELRLLTEAGLTPRQALAAATGNVARVFRWPSLGAVAPGHLADLLVVDADPTRDIRNLKRIRLVVLGGRIVDRAALRR